MGKTARRGRPRARKPKQGDRVSLGLRVTAEMKLRLDDAAAKSGRSQSQEAELRLERSFREEEALGGRAMRELGDLMRATFAFVAKRTANTSGNAEWTANDWIADQECYRAAAVDVCRVLIERLPNPSREEVSETLQALTRRLNIMLSRTGEIESGPGFVESKEKPR
jgi:hypothetical protein